MGQRYSVVFTAVAVSAAQDLFEINVASTRAFRLLSVVLGQSSDSGDAQDEGLGVTIVSGYTTSGSGGSSATPQKLSGAGSGAAASTAEINNTTVASAGTAAVHHSDAFNIRAGWQYRPIPEEMIELPPSSRLVVRLTAPADALTMSGTLIFEEVG